MPPSKGRHELGLRDQDAAGKPRDCSYDACPPSIACSRFILRSTHSLPGGKQIVRLPTRSAWSAEPQIADEARLQAAVQQEVGMSLCKESLIEASNTLSAADSAPHTALASKRVGIGTLRAASSWVAPKRSLRRIKAPNLSSCHRMLQTTKTTIPKSSILRKWQKADNLRCS